jgi:hypothetical protein
MNEQPDECGIQHPNESTQPFANRFLCWAVNAGRCQDPVLGSTFAQHLLPELRTNVCRQRLHSLADIVSFTCMWLTTRKSIDACATLKSDQKDDVCLAGYDGDHEPD